MEWFNVTLNGLAWHQIDLAPHEWFSVTANNPRRNRQNYKSEMDKWSLK